MDANTTPTASSPTESIKEEEPFRFTWRLALAFTSICIIVLMAALDATSLSVALSHIATSVNGSAIEIFWAGTGFLITGAVFQPIIGSLSSILGRKLLTFISLALFGVGAIIAAVAQNVTVLLIGRCIQGVGGGGVIVLSEVLTTDLLPLRVRGQWQGLIAAMWALGTVGGPLIGGGFAQNVSWRWIFWINLPFIGVGSIVIALFLKLRPIEAGWAAKLRRIDYVGSFIFIGSTTSFLIPLSWGGVSYAWSSWRSLVPLIIGAVGLVVFVIWEERYAEEPLIPLRIVKNRSAAVNYLGGFLQGLVLCCLLYYLPLYYEGVLGYSPIVSGVALFPETFTVAPAAGTVGFLVTKTGRYRWAIWGGWFMATLGSGLIVLLDVDTSIPAWIFLTLVGGIGLGMLFPSIMFGIQAATPEIDVAAAVSLFTFVRMFGQAVGVAVGGVIFQNQVKKQILSHPLIASHAQQYAQDASSLVQIIKAMPQGQEKHDLQTSYAAALRVVWALMCGLCFLGLVTSFATKGYSLGRAHVVEQGFVSGEEKKTESQKVADHA
ncbi:hypothetical protein M3J09_012576 [Ascochyta lentis]